jgi:hypothetical protein
MFCTQDLGRVVMQSTFGANYPANEGKKTRIVALHVTQSLARGSNRDHSWQEGRHGAPMAVA